MNNVSLVDVTKENWFDICCLTPGEEGREFVASNSFSIAQSVFEDEWIIKGLETDGKLIGFTMYGYSDEVNGYEICRLMIDESYQGKGYGTCALRTIIDEMVRVYKCDEILLSTAPNNARGKHLYSKVGFVPTGETCGEDDDVEDIFSLKLSR